jgi:hypothetical protein
MKWDNKDPIDNKLEQVFFNTYKSKWNELADISQEEVINGAKPEKIIYDRWMEFVSGIEGVEHSKIASGFNFPSNLHWLEAQLKSGAFVGKRIIRDLVGEDLNFWQTNDCDFIIVDEQIVDKILVLGYVA